MFTYLFLDMRGGFEMQQEYPTMMDALRRAAIDHESCGLRVPNGITAPDGTQYSQQDVLMKCQEAGLFG